MGIETLVGGAILGSTLLGMKQQSRAAKSARQAADAQSNAIAEQQSLARAEQSRLSSRLDASKKKLAIGMARSNRRRSKGGLFGDAAESNTPPPSNTLGG